MTQLNEDAAMKQTFLATALSLGVVAVLAGVHGASRGDFGALSSGVAAAFLLLLGALPRRGRMKSS